MLIFKKKATKLEIIAEVRKFEKQMREKLHEAETRNNSLAEALVLEEAKVEKEKEERRKFEKQMREKLHEALKKEVGVLETQTQCLRGSQISMLEENLKLRKDNGNLRVDNVRLYNERNIYREALKQIIREK